MSCKQQKKPIDAADLLEQASAIGHVVSERAVEAGKAAAALANQGVDWATPKIAAAIDWATPRAENAWREGVKAAAPKIEAAAQAVKPAVASAQEKLVADILPRLVAAADAAADAAAEAAAKAEARVDNRIDEIVQAATAAEPKSSRGKKFRWVLVGAAVAGTGYLLWKRTKPIEDPWAEEYWDDASAQAASEAEAAPEEPAAGEAAEEAEAAPEEPAEAEEKPEG